MTERAGDAEGTIVLVAEAAERVLRAVSVAAWHERRSEWGGLLFGREYRQSGRRVVWLAAAVPGLGSGTPVSFEIEPASYVLAQRLLGRDPCSQGLEEVGLWHSHPRLHVFPSPVDAEYHRLAFPTPGSLSLIIDPFAPAAAVYVSTGTGIEPVAAYSFGGDGFGPAPDMPLLRPWDPEEVRGALA